MRIDNPSPIRVSPHDIVASHCVSAPTPEAGVRNAVTPEAKDGTDFAISVVVPTYRRPHTLRRCLSALMTQRMSGMPFEILVCDDGPEEQTRQLVAEFAQQALSLASKDASELVVRYLPVTGSQGPAGARNVGWRAARAELVAFTDDDTEPMPGWLHAGWQAMRFPYSQSGIYADAVSGKIVVPTSTPPSDYERNESGLQTAEFATANVFVRRSFLVRCGGFDSRFTSAWREDSDMHFMLLDAGAVVGRVEDAVIVHPVRPARWGISISQQRKSQFDALLYRKHPALFRARIYPVFPVRYYVILGAALVGLLAALAGRSGIAACAALVWAVATAQFAFLRLRGTRHDWYHVSDMLCTSIVLPFLSIGWRLVGAVRFKVLFL